MSKLSDFNFLEAFHVTMETPFTIENFDEIKTQVLSSPLDGMINLIFCQLLDKAILSGWNPRKEKLGDYKARRLAEHVDPEFLNQNKDITLMLNQFGDRYLEDTEVPLVVIRDKETDEIITSNPFEMAFVADDVVE